MATNFDRFLADVLGQALGAAAPVRPGMAPQVPPVQMPTPQPQQPAVFSPMPQQAPRPVGQSPISGFAQQAAPAARQQVPDPSQVIMRFRQDDGGGVAGSTDDRSDETYVTVTYQQDGITYFLLMPEANARNLPEGATLVPNGEITDPARIQNAREAGERGVVGQGFSGMLDQAPPDVQAVFRTPAEEVQVQQQREIAEGVGPIIPNEVGQSYTQEQLVAYYDQERARQQYPGGSTADMRATGDPEWMQVADMLEAHGITFVPAGQVPVLRDGKIVLEDGAQMVAEERDREEALAAQDLRPHDTMATGEPGIATSQPPTPEQVAADLPGLTTERLREMGEEGGGNDLIVKAAVLEDAGIFNVPTGQMAVRYQDGTVALVDSADTAPEGAEILVYGGESEPLDPDRRSNPFGLLTPIPGVSTVADATERVMEGDFSGAWDVVTGDVQEAWGFSTTALDFLLENVGKPAGGLVAGTTADIRETIDRSWDTIWSATPEPVRDIIEAVGDPAQRAAGAVWDNAPLVGPVGLSDVVERVPDVVPYIGIVTWGLQNPDMIRDVYENGWDGDGDGVADYTGHRAVWEAFQNSHGDGAWGDIQRGWNDIWFDPLNLFTVTGGLLTRVGTRILGGAGAATDVPFWRWLAGGGLRTVGRGLQLPDELMDSVILSGLQHLWRPLSGALRRIPGMDTLLDLSPRALIDRVTEQMQPVRDVIERERDLPTGGTVEGPFPLGPTSPEGPSSGGTISPQRRIQTTEERDPVTGAVIARRRLGNTLEDGGSTIERRTPGPAMSEAESPYTTISPRRPVGRTAANVTTTSDVLQPQQVPASAMPPAAAPEPTTPRVSSQPADMGRTSPRDPFEGTALGEPTPMEKPDWDFMSPKGREERGPDEAARLIDAVWDAREQYPQRWQAFMTEHATKAEARLERARRMRTARGTIPINVRADDEIDRARYVINDLLPDIRRHFGDDADIGTYRFETNDLPPERMAHKIEHAIFEADEDLAQQYMSALRGEQFVFRRSDGTVDFNPRPQGSLNAERLTDDQMQQVEALRARYQQGLQGQRPRATGSAPQQAAQRDWREVQDEVQREVSLEQMRPGVKKDGYARRVTPRRGVSVAEDSALPEIVVRPDEGVAGKPSVHDQRWSVTIDGDVVTSGRDFDGARSHAMSEYRRRLSALRRMGGDAEAAPAPTAPAADVAESAATETEVRRLPLSRIRSTFGMSDAELEAAGVRRFQPRDQPFSEASAADVAERFDPSAYTPIEVTPGSDGNYYILSGHSRYEGFRRAGRNEMDVIIRRGTPEEMEARAWMANTDAARMTPLEEAKVVQRRVDAGETFEQIADSMKAGSASGRRGVNRVRQLYYLNFLPETSTLRKAVAEGTVEVNRGARLGEAIGRGIITPAEADATFRELTSGDMTLTDVNRAINRHAQKVGDGGASQMKLISDRDAGGTGFAETVRELRDMKTERNTLVADRQAINRAARRRKGGLTDEDRTNLEEIRDRIAEIDAELEELDQTRFVEPMRVPDTQSQMEVGEAGRPVMGTRAIEGDALDAGDVLQQPELSPAEQMRAAGAIDLFGSQPSAPTPPAATAQPEALPRPKAELNERGQRAVTALEKAYRAIDTKMNRGIKPDTIMTSWRKALAEAEQQLPAGEYEYIEEISTLAANKITQYRSRFAAIGDARRIAAQDGDFLGLGDWARVRKVLSPEEYDAAVEDMIRIGSDPMGDADQVTPAMRRAAEAYSRQTDPDFAEWQPTLHFSRIIKHMQRNTESRATWEALFHDALPETRWEPSVSGPQDVSSSANYFTATARSQAQAQSLYRRTHGAVSNPLAAENQQAAAARRLENQWDDSPISPDGQFRGRVLGKTEQDLFRQRFTDADGNELDSVAERLDRYAEDRIARGMDVESAEVEAARQVINEWAIQALRDRAARGTREGRRWNPYNKAYQKYVERVDELIRQADLPEEVAQVRSLSESLRPDQIPAYDTALGVLREMALYNTLTGPRYIMTQVVGNTISALLTGNADIVFDAMSPRMLREAYRQLSDHPADLMRPYTADVFEATGMVRPTPTAVVKDEVTIRGTDLRLHQATDKIFRWKRDPLPSGESYRGPRFSSILANKHVRDFANAVDLAFRNALADHTFRNNLAVGSRDFREYALERLPSRISEDAFERVWNTLPQDASPGAFSSDDVRRVFRELGDDNYADRMARDWQSSLTTWRKAAVDETNRVFFTGDEHNLDAVFRRIVFFHYWMSRAAPLYTTSLMKHAGVLNAYLNMMEEMEETAQEYGDAVDGFVKFFSTPMGYNVFIRPDAMFQVFSMFWEDAGYAPDGENLLGKFMRSAGVMFNPLIATVVNLSGSMGDTFAPDPFLLGQWSRLVQNSIDFGRSRGWLKGNRPAGNVYNEIGTWSRSGVTGITEHFIPGVEHIPYRDSAVFAHRELNMLIYDVAEEQGLDPNSVEVQVALNNPDHPLYQEAFRRMADQGMLDHAFRYTPGLNVLYPKSRVASMDERNRQIEALPEGEERDRLVEQRANANVVDPDQSRLRLETDQYYQIGDEATREAYDTYNAIRYGDATEPVVIGDRTYTPQQVAGMGDESRKALADEWAEANGYAESIGQLREDRGAFLDAGGEFASYRDWQNTVRDYPGGPLQWWRDTARHNPNAARWLQDYEQTYDGPVRDFDNGLTSQRAYAAVVGNQANYRDPSPISTNTGNAPYMASVPQESSGSGFGSGPRESGPTAEGIQEDIAKYEAEKAEYDRIVSNMFGQQVSIDQLNPMARAAVVRNVRDYYGVSEPSMGKWGSEYLEWMARQQGGDTSIAAYLEWRRRTGGFGSMSPNPTELPALAPAG